MKHLNNMQPDIVYQLPNSIIPAKSLSYKRDPKTNEVLETLPPRTHEFEKQLMERLRQKLRGNALFPTSKEVLVVIAHGLHSEREYKEHDLDNRAKTVLDALKGVVYKDDAQVKILSTYKDFLRSAQESFFRISIKLLTKQLSAQLIRQMEKL